MDNEHEPRRGLMVVIGSTGPMGRAVLDVASSEGDRVRAFARSPEALADAGVEVVRGDVRDQASLVAALSGAESVVSVLGSRPGSGGAHLLEEGTLNVLAAMEATGVSRLVAVTGMGAGSSRGHGPFWYDALVRPTILRGVYADKEAQEKAIRASSVEWTIVRPAVLVSEPRTAPVRAQVDLAPREKMGALTRADVARFLESETFARRFVRQTVHLFTESA